MKEKVKFAPYLLLSIVKSNLEAKARLMRSPAK